LSNFRQREDRWFEKLTAMIPERERGYMQIDTSGRGWYLTEWDSVEEWRFEIGRYFLGCTAKAAYRAMRKIYVRPVVIRYMRGSKLAVWVEDYLEEA